MYVCALCVRRVFGDQKRVWDPLDLELQMVGSPPVGIEPWSSRKTASAHNGWTISLAPEC